MLHCVESLGRLDLDTAQIPSLILVVLNFMINHTVSQQAYAGQRKADPTSDQLYCLVESEDSNTVPVMCPAPPTSPVLRLEGMHTEGIDIIWEMPQQYGDAAVSVSTVML